MATGEITVRIADSREVIDLIGAARLLVRDLVRAYPVAPEGLCAVCHHPITEGHSRGCSVGPLVKALEPFNKTI